MTRTKQEPLAAFRNGTAIVALAFGALVLPALVVTDHAVGAAYAQGAGGDGDDHGGDDGGSGGAGPGQPGGNPNAGGGGQAGGGHGQGAPDPDSEGRGPAYGQPDDDEPRGGRPPWAKEGLPEVELGRLNVVRSPDRVIDQAFAEALATITPDMVAFYNQSLDEIINALATDFDNQSLIDSPLQNLGLLRDALDGSSDLAALGVTSSVDTLIPVFLGVAADKTLEVTPEAAYVVSYLLGFELTAAQAVLLAEEADAVREAILLGHG